jgi:hypothetical protein
MTASRFKVDFHFEEVLPPVWQLCAPLSRTTKQASNFSTDQVAESPNGNVPHSYFRLAWQRILLAVSGTNESAIMLSMNQSTNSSDIRMSSVIGDCLRI